MHALLDAVARGRGRRRRIAVTAAAVVLAALVVPVVWWSRTRDAADPCPSADAEISSVWSVARGADLAAAFPDHAAGRAAAARSRDRLDAYARAWATGHRAACRATAVDHAQSEDLLDRRMVCLARARTRLDVLVSSLARAGVDAADDVESAIDALPSLDHCADVVALGAVVPRPEGVDARRRVAEAANRLDQLSAGVKDPTHPIRIEDTARALEEARVAGWAPLIAEAAMIDAAALLREANLTESSTRYLDALGWALQGGDDHLATRAFAELAWGEGLLGRRDSAVAYLGLARSMSRRLGEPAELALLITTTAGEVARQFDDLDGAIEAATAALALASAPGAAAGAHGRAITNLGLAQMGAGRYDLAVEHLAQAVELAKAEVGAAHPLVANRLSLLGTIYLEWGRSDEARAAIAEGLAIRQAWYGPDDVELLSSLQMTATIDQRAGDVDAARPMLERAIAIAKAHAGLDPTQLIELEANLAMLEAQVGNYGVAVELGAAALGGLEALIGPDDPGLIEALILVGYAERGLGELDASAEHLRRAVTIAEQKRGPSHPVTANPRIELGNTEVARGRIREAIALYERVVADGEADANLERRLVAEASLALSTAS